MKSIIAVILLLTIEVYLSSQACKKYVCSQLDERTCMFEDRSDNKFILQKCSDESQFCPFMNNKDGSVKCVSRDGYHPRSFPGGVCEEDSGCIAGNCVNGICEGKQNGEECKNHMECPYGHACKKNGERRTCQPQSAEGEACDEDFDCQNSHGCSLGKCVAYLSLPNGASIDFNPKNALPVCESGLYYKGKCATLTNVGNNPMECDDSNPCKYKLDDGSEIQVEEFCACGKNPLGLKVCKLGNGNNEWAELLNSLKTLLTTTDNCNTVERGVCMSHAREMGREMQEFMIAKTKILRYHELAGADDCVLNILFPEIARNQRYRLRVAMKEDN